MKWNTVKILACSLVMPSVLLPIKYSSILLIIICSIIAVNLLIYKNNKIPKFFFYPFVAYYISVIISFIIDIFNGFIEFDFLLRNIIILIIPLFVFTSNFNTKEVFKILKFSSIIISITGIVIIAFWLIGYNKHSNSLELQKSEWYKNEITLSNFSSNKDSIFTFTIDKSSKRPSLRKIESLSRWNKKDSIVRELTIKVEPTKNDAWLLFRNLDDDNNHGAWFNAKNGQIGKQLGVGAKSINLSNGYYKFTLKNKPNIHTTKEWFYVSFVSGDGQYRWRDKSDDENVKVQLKPPKFYIDAGENLLKKPSLLNYKLTKFSFFENYAHGTYMALVFAFALVVLIFNSFLRKWLKNFFILTNIFAVYALASKAVIISLLVLFIIYYFNRSSRYKLAIVVIISIIAISLNGYMRERFVDMYQTIINIDNIERLGELDQLSTNQRIKVYKDYSHLIKENLIGYGNSNGKKIIKSLFGYNYNTHNQYLQSLFNSGIFGFLLLVIFCISPLVFKRSTFNKKNGLLFFIAVILFNFLFESIMYRQWGLIIVSFSFAIYFQMNKSRLKWFQ